MKQILYKIAIDTLTREGRFSRTSLTMFSAWIASLLMALIDFFCNGLRYDVWLTLVGVAMGSKIVDKFAKK